MCSLSIVSVLLFSAVVAVVPEVPEVVAGEEGEVLAVTELASGGRLSTAVWPPVSQLAAGVGQLVSQLSLGHGQSGGLVVSGNFRAIYCCVL